MEKEWKISLCLLRQVFVQDIAKLKVNYHAKTSSHLPAKSNDYFDVNSQLPQYSTKNVK